MIKNKLHIVDNLIKKTQLNPVIDDFFDTYGHRIVSALRLLKKMEDVIRDEGFKTFYTIARALSAGMNITFARCGYQYGGTLINNTNISGGIENMNVWYKNIE